MNHLRNVLDGFTGVLTCAVQQRQYTIENHGFTKDQKMLCRDFVVVGSDIKSGLRKYGEIPSSKSHKQKR